MKIFMLLVCGLLCCVGGDVYGCEWTRARSVQPVYVPVQQIQPSISWSYVQQNVINYIPTVIYQPVVNTQVIAVPTAIYPIYTPVPVVPYFYGYSVYRYQGNSANISDTVEGNKWCMGGGLVEKLANSCYCR